MKKFPKIFFIIALLLLTGCEGIVVKVELQTVLHEDPTGEPGHYIQRLETYYLVTAEDDAGVYWAKKYKTSPPAVGDKVEIDESWLTSFIVD